MRCSGIYNKEIEIIKEGRRMYKEREYRRLANCNEIIIQSGVTIEFLDGELNHCIVRYYSDPCFITSSAEMNYKNDKKNGVTIYFPRHMVNIYIEKFFIDDVEQKSERKINYAYKDDEKRKKIK